MKFFKPFGIGFALIIVIVFVITIFLPSNISIERSIQIDSGIEIVFEQVNTLKNWENWSPWAELDKDMATAYGNISSGEGAFYTWKGNDKVGSGRLTIVSSLPLKSIITKIDFDGKQSGNGVWIFEKMGKGTRVIWKMETDIGWSPMGKILGLFMDKIIGEAFEIGLKNLKRESESIAIGG